jgi:hypothetical protein
LEFKPAVRTYTGTKPANMRFVSWRLASNCFEFTKIVNKGAPFQNTTASVPKFSPFTVIVKGTLLTGTLLGVSAASEGGENVWVILPGPRNPGPAPVPHPMAQIVRTTRLIYRITPPAIGLEKIPRAGEECGKQSVLARKACQ